MQWTCLWIQGLSDELQEHSWEYWNSGIFCLCWSCWWTLEQDSCFWCRNLSESRVHGEEDRRTLVQIHHQSLLHSGSSRHFVHEDPSGLGQWSKTLIKTRNKGLCLWVLHFKKKYIQLWQPQMFKNQNQNLGWIDRLWKQPGRRTLGDTRGVGSQCWTLSPG